MLRQIKSTTLDALAHQEVPFEQVVQALGVERSLSHTPLFQVMFILQSNQQPAIQLKGIESRIYLAAVMAKFDLS